MKVFKFGGASIKNSKAIENMSKIVKNYLNERLVIVVSAMGKTTNILEKILELKIEGKDYSQDLFDLKNYHFDIIHNLFDENHKVLGLSESIFSNLENNLKNKNGSYEDLYDEVASQGEFLSSTIISQYFLLRNISCELTDVTKLIETDNTPMEALVNWKITSNKIKQGLLEKLKENIILTQGFIGGTSDGKITTLGREGSDFTAAIFASCLNAESVTVWKDVPGILSADPKIIKETVLFKELPYQEASEMTYYGAKVIHPRTIKPLANKKIPLFIKSFDNPLKDGTCIHDCKLNNPIPAIIYKKNQCLFSFKVVDFTFVNEKGISKIFKVLHDLNIKMNIMQNSAISLSVCFDYHTTKVNELKKRLHDDFNYYYNTGLTLITLKNYDKKLLEEYSSRTDILLEQKSRKNYRILVSD